MTIKHAKVTQKNAVKENDITLRGRGGIIMMRAEVLWFSFICLSGYVKA